MRFPDLVFLFLSLNQLLLSCVSEVKPCLQKRYGNDFEIVCVCNSSYCDQIPPVGKLEPYQAAIYTSSKSGKRLERTDATFVNSKKRLKKGQKIKINGQASYQSIIGFGGAFTDAASINLKFLSGKAQDLLLEAYFGRNGLQYTTGRVPIASCDFSMREYSYADTPDDFELQRFGLVQEDLEYKIPFIKRAINLTQGAIKLFASPWSAPGWMKTNGRMKGGGKLKDDPDSRYHKSWASYYIRFLEEYAKNGINFWGLTVQNEPSSGSLPDYPFQTMYFSAETERDFVKNHLGPKLRNSSVGKDIALMILDDMRYVIPAWPNKVLEDSEASKYIAGIGVHWYADYALFPASRLTEAHNANPDKFILGTEACNGYGLWDRGPKLGSWSRAESYAKDIVEDLLNWVSGWTDWNLCLDLEGGPNWVKNFVDSPIIVNSTADEFYKQPMFYTMGHFSKFVRPASVRIGLQIPDSVLNDNLEGVAFTTPERQRVLILVNRHDTTFDNVIVEDAAMIKKALNIKVEAHSITTIVWNKVK